jgi:hypothetical protein
LRTRLKRKIHHALVLAPEDVSALWALLASYTKRRISARCVDGSILETEELDELLSFENVGFRRIETIEFAANNSFEERCRLVLRDAGTTGEWEAEGPDDKQVLHISNEVHSRLRDTRPAYSPFCHFEAANILSVICGVLGIWWTLKRLGGIDPPLPGASRLYFVDWINLTFLGAGLFFLLTWPVNRAQRWLFPRVFFRIGRQESQWHKRERARELLGLTFILSILASIIATFLYDRFKRGV